MAANILDVCDALVSKVITAWTAITADDSVERVYLAPIKVHTQIGRHVYIFPTNYENSPATRSEDDWTYQIGVVVVERHDSSGEPATSWMDTRVNFVQDKVFDALDFARAPLIVGSGLGLITQTSSVEVYDETKLNELHTFWSELTFTFTEIRS